MAKVLEGNSVGTTPKKELPQWQIDLANHIISVLGPKKDEKVAVYIPTPKREIRPWQKDLAAHLVSVLGPEKDPNYGKGK